MNYLIYSLLLMNLTFIYFIAIMKMRDIKDAGELVGFTKYLCYFNLLIGAILDVLVNWFPMTIIMLELPKEFLTTARLSRHIKDGEGWRKAVALWFCRTLLSTFDSTKNHCSENDAKAINDRK